MIKRKFLVRFESGHALKAVCSGENPELGGTNLFDSGDDFYYAELKCGLYDVFWKNESGDAIWLALPHYNERYFPTDEIDAMLEEHNSRISAFEIFGPPDAPDEIEAIHTCDGIAISWVPHSAASYFVVRGKFFHRGELVVVNEDTRILYAGYAAFCVIPNFLRSIDLRTSLNEEVFLAFKVSAKNPAGTSEISEQFTIALDLSRERREINGGETFCVTTSFAGHFPQTNVSDEDFPVGEPARRISLPRVAQLIRVEVECTKAVTQTCHLFFADSFTHRVEQLALPSGSRYIKNALPFFLSIGAVMNGELLIYSPDGDEMLNAEIRLWFA